MINVPVDKGKIFFRTPTAQSTFAMHKIPSKPKIL
jgi:hypothetical protein